MKIGNVRHKGLSRFIEKDESAGLPASLLEKIRNILSFLQDMEHVSELQSIPSWNAHLLTGDRKGRWSLTVSRNWRITFRIDEVEQTIVDLDYEDYH